MEQRNRISGSSVLVHRKPVCQATHYSLSVRLPITTYPSALLQTCPSGYYTINPTPSDKESCYMWSRRSLLSSKVAKLGTPSVVPEQNEQWLLNFILHFCLFGRKICLGTCTVYKARWKDKFDKSTMNWSCIYKTIVTPISCGLPLHALSGMLTILTYSHSNAPNHLTSDILGDHVAS